MFYSQYGFQQEILIDAMRRNADLLDMRINPTASVVLFWLVVIAALAARVAYHDEITHAQGVTVTGSATASLSTKPAF